MEVVLMGELRPCPFCGMKPDPVYCGPGVYVSCCNDDCPCTCEAWGENEDKAEEAWNTRACEILEGDGTGEALPEIRTCNIDYVKYGPMYDVWRCSACGYEHAESVSEEGIVQNYCPNCGAKVVDG